MTFAERIEQLATALWLGVAGLAVTAFGWVVRHVLTSQAKIELLANEIKHRDQLRQEDREHMKEVREDVKALRDDVGKLLGRTE
jgi:hypothetical protein